MKLFAQMLFCVLLGIVIGVAARHSDRQQRMVEVSIERVVTSPEDHTMRFADMPVPYTVFVYRPPQQRWAVPGIAGDVNQQTWAIPPHN